MFTECLSTAFRLSTVHYILQNIFFLGLVQQLGNTEADLVSKSTVPPYFFSKGKLTPPASFVHHYSKRVKYLNILSDDTNLTQRRTQGKLWKNICIIHVHRVGGSHRTQSIGAGSPGPESWSQSCILCCLGNKHSSLGAMLDKLATGSTNLWLMKKWGPVYHDAAGHNICFAWFSAYRLPLPEGLVCLLIQLPSNRSF